MLLKPLNAIAERPLEAIASLTLVPRYGFASRASAVASLTLVPRYGFASRASAVAVEMRVSIFERQRRSRMVKTYVFTEI